MTEDMSAISQLGNQQNVVYDAALFGGESALEAVEQLSIKIDVSIKDTLRRYGAALFVRPAMLALVYEERAEALKNSKIAISLISRKNLERLSGGKAEDFAVWSPRAGVYEIFVVADIRHKDLQELQASSSFPRGLQLDLSQINACLAAAMSLVGGDAQDETARENALDEGAASIHNFEDVANKRIAAGEDMEPFAAYPLALTTNPAAVNWKERT